MNKGDGRARVERESKERLDLLSRVVTLAVTAGTEDELVREVLEVTLDHLGARVGSILLYDEAQKHLYVKYGKGLAPELATRIRIKIGDGISGWVAQRKQPLLVKDIENDPVFGRISNPKYETRSLISAPLIGKDRLIGVVNVNNKKDGASFNEDDLSLLATIAREISIAMENFHLVESLQKKAEVLEAANRQLIEMGKARADFMSRVSHELRTPLNSIKGAAYYLLTSKGYNHATLVEFLQIITDESNRLIRMIDDLLDLSTLEDKEGAIKKVDEDLLKILGDIAAIFRPQASERGVEIVTDFPSLAEPVKVDRDRIIQLFTNIVGNGVKYTGQGGRVLIRVREEEEHLKVEVSDTGSGIPEEELPYIFDKYRTVGEAGEEVARTGLGLYISHKIIELHGGKIDVESRMGEGTTFTVTLQKREDGDYQKDLKKTLDLLSDMIAEVMHVKITSLMLVDEATDELTISSAHGLDEATVRNTRIKIGDKIAGWVALEGKPILIEDMEKDLRLSRRSITQYSTKSLLSVPIKVGDRVAGVINVNNKEDGSVFSEADLELCTALSERIAVILQKLDRYNNKDSLLKEMSLALETLVKAKRNYPAEREHGVAMYIFPLLKYMGISGEEGRIIYYASTLYDLGLTTVNENVLRCDGSLSDEDRQRIREHPLAGLSLIEPLEFVEMVKMIILHHHERYDGRGYPDGLAGEDIPLGARILAVLDSFCAMTRRRGYRPMKSMETALEELSKEAGTLYDPLIVEKFIEVVNTMREESRK